MCEINVKMLAKGEKDVKLRIIILQSKHINSKEGEAKIEAYKE